MVYLSSEAARFTFQYTVVSVGNVDTALVGANASRVGLWLTPANLVRVTYSPAGAAVLDQGLTVQAAGIPIYLDTSQTGELVKQAWRAINSGAGAVSVGIIEILRG